MAIRDIIDNVSTDVWWKVYPGRVAAFFVELDANGNVVDSGIATNGVIGQDVNFKSLATAARNAIKTLNF